jgi:hypothetical protein
MRPVLPFSISWIAYEIPSIIPFYGELGQLRRYSDGPRARGWGSIPERDKRFFSTPQRQDRLSDPPASYPIGTESCLPGGKAAMAWSWLLTSILCRGQEYCYTSTIPYVFIAWQLINHRVPYYVYQQYGNTNKYKALVLPAYIYTWDTVKGIWNVQAKLVKHYVCWWLGRWLNLPTLIRSR